MLLLQHASWEGEFKELLDRLQVRVGPCYSYDYCITISKPESRKKKVQNGRPSGNFSKEYLTLRTPLGPWKREVPARPRNKFQRAGTSGHVLNTYSMWAALPRALDMTSLNPHLDLWGLSDVTEKLKPTESVTCSWYVAQKWWGQGVDPTCAWLWSLCSNLTGTYKSSHYISITKLESRYS